MRPDFKLVAGHQELKEFCLRFFKISDPIIVIWRTEQKPKSSNNVDKTIEKIKSSEEIVLFFKENLDSLFFPNGYVVNEWNLVLVSIKNNDIKYRYPNVDCLIKGWMMGTEINLKIINDKF